MSGYYSLISMMQKLEIPSVSNVLIPSTIIVGTPISVTYTLGGGPASTITRKWYRGATLIFTSTSSDSYTPTQSDAGNTSNIACFITATNGAGMDNALSSAVAQVLTLRTYTFLQVSLITDSAIKSALNNLDIGFIANNFVSRTKALYPIKGGTAATHKYNFMDPRDLDAAFRITFSGGWVHSATGALPNGINAYANPHVNVAADLGAIHTFGIYSRTNDTSSNMAYGCFNGSSVLFLQHNIGSGIFVSGGVAGIVSYTPNPSQRLLLGTRRSPTEFEAYRDGVSLGKDTTTQPSVVNLEFYFGARKEVSSITFYNKHEIAFGILCNDSFSPAEVTILKDLVNQFLTALSINV